jgi:predicted RNA-binding Zn-ribbon protein involved in translation (DUF1610 family)
MEALDGNAIGGAMYDIFGVEMTAAMTICLSCGGSLLLAEQAVYSRGPGIVVRCRTCESILLVWVNVRGMNCIDTSGLAVLEPVLP